MRWRRPVLGAFIAVLLLLALDTIAWVLACKRLDAGFADAVAQGQQNGWTVTAGRSRWSGWPVAAEVELPSVMARAGPFVFPSDLLWTADLVRLRLEPFRPTLLAILVAGRQTVAASGVPVIPFQSRRFAVAIDLTGRAPARATIAGLEAVLPNGKLGADSVELSFPPAAIVADAHGVEAPDSSGRALDPKIDQIGLRISAAPPFPVAPTAAESARAWRAAGGRVEVTDLLLQWAALTATGRAAGGLDAELQPEADGSVDASGLPDLLDRFVRSGMLAPSAAVAAKAVLAILAAPAHGGPVPLPLSLRGGVLSVARIAVIRLPALAWD